MRNPPNCPPSPSAPAPPGKPRRPSDLDDSAGGGSRLGLSLRETPGSVSVANRASFERRGLRSTQDIANSLPGVNASAPPGFGGFVTYRGFSSNQVNQLFQRHSGAIQQRHASAGRLGSSTASSWSAVRPPSSTAPVPSAARWTTSASSPTATAISWKAGCATAATTIRKSPSASTQALGIGPEPKHFVRLDVSRSGGNGYVDRNSRESWNVAFSLLSDLTPDLSHTWPWSTRTSRKTAPTGGTPVLNPYAGELKIDKSRRRENYNVADGRYEQRVRWLRSILEYRVSDSTRWRNTFYHYDAERDYRNLETYRYNADNSGVVRSNAFLQRHDQQLNGNRFELQHSQPLFRTGQRLGAGLRLQHQQADALPEYRLRAVRYGRSGQFRAGPLLRPAGHASRPPEGPQQRGAHQRVVRREPPGPDRRAVAGHRAALRPPRPRRAQPSGTRQGQSRTLRTALGRGHRARRAGLPVHSARQRLPAIQYRRRPAGPGC
ncbi:putative outer membrane ferric siderophore receptor [Pseudomonas aeruginosa]|nr:putative outer membrane ferric siderophore receptor [Pseudomonas aeruginosa]